MNKITTIIASGIVSLVLLTSFIAITNNDDEVTIAVDNRLVFRKEISTTDPSCLQLYYYIEQYADSFNIPKKYAYGIAHAETGYNGPFDWNYEHKRTSPAGAVGPMQVMVATAVGINHEKVTANKLKNNVEYNVRTSMKLLRILHDKYDDWKLVFGAYNTGRAVVNNYAIKVYNYEPNWTNQ